MGNSRINNICKKLFLSYLRHYDEAKYWRMREYVVSPTSRNKIKQLIYLYRIKKSDAFNCASMGTELGEGAVIVSPPHLPHGLNGIIVSKYAKLGAHCKIYQQVTITTKLIDGVPVSAIIGDNCTLGAKSTILAGVRIGNNVKIGANAVVTKDVPDNCSVGGIPACVLNYYDN
jgi:serine O-acetyltransferase